MPSVKILQKVKGLFLLANDNPDFKESEGGKFYYILLSYLEKQTTIIEIPFWIELEKERTRKLECCKHIVLLTNFGKVHLDSPEKMSVFVMMSGRITVVSSVSFQMWFLDAFRSRKLM
jgi:hypothetical protein